MFSTSKDEDFVFIHIGGLRVTRAAFVAILCGLILAIISAFTVPFGPFVAIYLLLVFSLLAYNVNCVQVGHCKAWGWILTIFYVFFVASVVAAFWYNRETAGAMITEKFKVNTVRRNAQARFK